MNLSNIHCNYVCYESDQLIWFKSYWVKPSAVCPDSELLMGQKTYTKNILLTADILNTHI
jgi:hypothetical protein